MLRTKGLMSCDDRIPGNMPHLTHPPSPLQPIKPMCGKMLLGSENILLFLAVGMTVDGTSWNCQKPGPGPNARLI